MTCSGELSGHSLTILSTCIKQQLTACKALLHTVAGDSPMSQQEVEALYTGLDSPHGSLEGQCPPLRRLKAVSGDPSDIFELGSCLCGQSPHTKLPTVRGPRTKSVQCYADLRAAKVLDNGLVHKLASEMNRLDSFSLYDEVPEESITAFYGKEDDTASEATVSDCLFNESDKEEAGSDAATSAPQTTSSEEVLLIDAPEDKVDKDWSAFGF